MGYTALYRKFRPITFSEIVGQEHITKTLRNQIIAGRVGHAYLFNGGRGTGKTSAAKILARAVNCLNPKKGEPCNECEICKGAMSGSLTDIVEMDAASNNSVEDIRTIREEVNFLPTKAKYRVYIIDEVHMLSTGAFNALLKTLEEPPEHVKFILATTEPQKLPATILSRCQRFDFKRISNEDIIKRLQIVCDESNIEITREALNIIAVLSEGAMRDALSILERCIQDGQNNIDENKIKELVGIPKKTYIHKITEGIIEYNVEEVLDVANKILEEGKDLNNLLWETIKYIKDVLICKVNGNLDLYTEQEKQEIKQISEKVSKQRAIKLIYDLSELEAKIKISTQKIIVFQAGLIKLCNQEVEDDINASDTISTKVTTNSVNSNLHENDLSQRLSKLESYVKSEEFANKLSTNYGPNVENKKKNEIKTKIKIPLGKTQEYWPQLVEELRKSRKMTVYWSLTNTTAREINDSSIGVEFPNGLTSINKQLLEMPENLELVNNLLSSTCGRPMQVKYIDNNIHEVEIVDNAKILSDLANGNGIELNVSE